MIGPCNILAPIKRITVTMTAPLSNNGVHVFQFMLYLNHISLASLLWDIGKQYSLRCDAAERGVPSGAILFAQRNFIEK